MASRRYGCSQKVLSKWGRYRDRLLPNVGREINSLSTASSPNGQPSVNLPIRAGLVLRQTHARELN